MWARRNRHCCCTLLFVSAAFMVGISIHFTRLSVEIRSSDIPNAYASTNDSDARERRLSSNEKPLRILYIVTSLAEYQNGRRFTTRGDDRLVNFMLPVVREGVESMLAKGYHVHVYLICHYTMRHHRRQLIQVALPKSVKLRIWDDATPIGYKLENEHNHTDLVTRGLARQHRFVIKDLLMDYDFFVNFEDDMLVKGDHVEHYLNMSQQLAALGAAAPTTRFVPKNASTPMKDIFYGPLQKLQFDRLVPGLMRVEVLRNEETHGAQAKLDPIPVDLVFDGETRSVDPRPCCHVSSHNNATHIPASPTSDKVFIWETGIKGLSVREIPGMGWVMLQSGSFLANRDRCIGNYWSGRDGHFGRNESRPFPGDALYLNNQGGWMATREQILTWHTQQCPCGFLPPYDEPCYELDGLDLRNVEYWSGGMSLFQAYKACNLQRIISLDPDEFSRQLIYHTANNKQRQLKRRGKQDRFVKVDNLLGQLNTVKKNAIAAKNRELEQ